MKSIPNRACEYKRRHAQTLPENGAQTVTSGTLEPLFCPPEYTSPTSMVAVLAPYSAANALHSLMTIGDQRYQDASNTISFCAHRICLGSRFFSEEEISEAIERMHKAVSMLEVYDWCGKAWWGLPQGEYNVHDRDLERLLEEMQEEDDRYADLTLEDLMGALVEVSR